MLRWTLWSMLSLAGCTSEQPTESIPGVDALDLGICEGDEWLAVHDLSPARAYDYYSLRASGGLPDAILDETGTLCGGASDQAACLNGMNLTLQGWPAPPEPGTKGFSTRYIAATVKDDRIVFTTVADLLKFLGPIDTAHEAALVAYAHGETILCRPRNARKTDDGFELLTHTAIGCGVRADMKLVRVKTDGSFNVVGTHVLDDGTSCGL